MENVNHQLPPQLTNELLPTTNCRQQRKQTTIPRMNYCCLSFLFSLRFCLSFCLSVFLSFFRSFFLTAQPAQPAAMVSPASVGGATVGFVRAMQHVSNGATVWASLFPFPQLILGAFFAVTRGPASPAAWVLAARAASFVIAGQVHARRPYSKLIGPIMHLPFLAALPLCLRWYLLGGGIGVDPAQRLFIGYGACVLLFVSACGAVPRGAAPSRVACVHASLTFDVCLFVCFWLLRWLMLVACGLWLVACGLWHLAFVIRHSAFVIRHSSFVIRHLAFGI